MRIIVCLPVSIQVIADSATPRIAGVVAASRWLDSGKSEFSRQRA